MSDRSGSMAARRAALQHRCALQREQLAQAVAALESRLHEVDRATLTLRKLRLGPVLLAVIGTAVAATPLFRNFSRGLTIANVIGNLLRSRLLGSDRD